VTITPGSPQTQRNRVAARRYYYYYYIMPPPLSGGALSADGRRLSVRLFVPCLTLS